MKSISVELLPKGIGFLLPFFLSSIVLDDFLPLFFEQVPSRACLLLIGCVDPPENVTLVNFDSLNEVLPFVQFPIHESMLLVWEQILVVSVPVVEF